MSNVDRLLIGGALAGILVAAAAAWSLLAVAGSAPEPLLAAGPPSAPLDTPPSTPTDLLVDVEGAVRHPGLHRLPAGARVADALAAAGGYSDDVDLAAAAARLNLAAPLSDGQQIHAPRVGDGAGPSGQTDTAGGGLVNLNTASPEALEALPGIGPVTVQKIVAARAERPFSSLDELVERGVMNRGQLAQIRDLATVQ